MPQQLTSIFSCSLLAITLASAHASSPTRWTICTDELKLIESSIELITQDEVVLIDDFGIRQSIQTSDLFFVVPSEPIAQPLLEGTETTDISELQPTRFITFVDGQIIQASILPNTNPDILTCRIVTDNTERGKANISLEQVLQITKTMPTDTITQPEDDTITTTTGDVLTGFIESIGEISSIETDTGVLYIPLLQIESIAFANIKEPSIGIYTSTTDGLRIKSDTFNIDFKHALAINIDHDSIGIAPSSNPTWLLHPNAASGFHVVHPSQHIQSLAHIQPELVEPTGDRAWTPTPSTITNIQEPILSSIDLRAPVRVVYPIPSNATRFACTLIAPINTWTDCIAEIYTITSSGTSTMIFSSPINADNPSHTIDFMLDSTIEKLEFRIEPGKHGPIQDRVLIEHPRLLIES